MEQHNGMCTNRRQSARSIWNHPYLLHRAADPMVDPKYCVIMVQGERLLFHEAGCHKIWEAAIVDAMQDPDFVENVSSEDLLHIHLTLNS